MCGIVGIFNFNSNEPVNVGILKKMRDTMVHRGPDGSGIWVSSDRRIALGHRRLSIIDLSETANQPLCNEDGTIWIVFNGEIYNHSEIRPELEARGHRFKTNHSDTEVIIHAFEEWGTKCVDKFRGMFAFVVYDDKKKEFWLFRDRMGIKPLYYTFQNGKFIFASEIKAILAHPDVPRAVDEEAFYHYLTFLTTPCPNTLFAGIKKLSPGCYGRVKRNGHIEEIRYWDVWDYTNPLTNVSKQEIAHRLLDELKIAVNYRKVSDVPVGIFLSGGVDSSINAVLFSEHEKNHVKTFSVGYDKEYQYVENEFKYAQVVAKIIGSNHYERKLSVDDVRNSLTIFVHHQDEPIADISCIPGYYVSKLARDNNIKVCQVGEGSDELFCGYSSWLRYIKFQKMSDLPFAGPVKKAGIAMLTMMGKEQKVRYEWLRRVASCEPVFWGGAEAFTEAQKKKLVSKRLRDKYSNCSSYEVLKPIRDRFEQKAWDKHPLNWMSYLDLNLRLPELLLMRVDKMSMATSVEARVPFLDHKVVELAMSIPALMKIENNETKHILKRTVDGLLPKEIIYRKKQGFSDLLSEWFNETLGDFAQKKIIDFTKRTDYFNESSIDNLFRTNNYTKFWLILNFVLWHEKWIEERE